MQRKWPKHSYIFFTKQNGESLEEPEQESPSVCSTIHFEIRCYKLFKVYLLFSLIPLFDVRRSDWWPRYKTRNILRNQLSSGRGKVLVVCGCAYLFANNFVDNSSFKFRLRPLLEPLVLTAAWDGSIPLLSLTLHICVVIDWRFSLLSRFNRSSATWICSWRRPVVPTPRERIRGRNRVLEGASLTACSKYNIHAMILAALLISTLDGPIHSRAMPKRTRSHVLPDFPMLQSDEPLSSCEIVSTLCSGRVRSICVSLYLGMSSRIFSPSRWMMAQAFLSSWCLTTNAIGDGRTTVIR